MKANKVYDEPLAPVDRVAARVISGGTHYDPKKKVLEEEFIAPPPMVPKHRHPRDASFIDLTGRKKGRFTVIGLMERDGPARWVVRCACGTYTLRTAKSIKSADTNPNARMDACSQCKHLAAMKREEVWRRTGKDANLEDIWD